MTQKIRHFLTLMDFSSDELRSMLTHAAEMKAAWKSGNPTQPLRHRSLAMLFEKSSTRTRVSFEVGMTQLGGHALFLSPRDTQLGRGEPAPDSIRVLTRMADAVMIRNDDHALLENVIEVAEAPIINGLSDRFHPCQLLADILTWQEHRGDIRGATAAWVGDGNNVCHSWMLAARQWGFNLRVATPAGYEPESAVAAMADDAVSICETPEQAVAGADLVVTDVWASMGQESEQTARVAAFDGYQVNRQLMEQADADAIFMHCLPAHRGEEVAAEVIDGPQSVVWDEAENRLHAQKALLCALIAPDSH